MPAQAFLRGSYVERRDDQRGIGAQRLGATRGGDGLGRARLARAGDDRHAFRHVFHREGEQALVFVMFEEMRLARRTRDDDRLRTTCKLLVEQAPEGVQVEGTVRGEGRRQCGDASGDIQGETRCVISPSHVTGAFPASPFGSFRAREARVSC